MAKNKTIKHPLIILLEEEVWPQVPMEQCGTRLTKAEEAAILGYSENDLTGQPELDSATDQPDF
jgi:hypothetical protein